MFTYRKSGALIAIGLMVLVGLACGQLTNLATSELEGQAATLAAAAGDLQPTLDAALTEAAVSGPTVEAALTQAAPLLTAPAPIVEGVLTRQWASEASASSEYGTEAWGAIQVIGEPNTFECADLVTAWASEFSTGIDTLSLFYAQPVVPTQINIYESYNPGAIVRVTVADSNNANSAVVYEADPQIVETCPRVLTVDISSVTFAVQRVTVEIDQTNHSGWNEIDAVELVGIALP